MKTHKRHKAGRMRGSRTHGWAMKKHKGSGNKGGKGMAGSGKRADHKKSWVIRYEYPYFGKQGFTSRSTERKKNRVINLKELENNLLSLVKNYGKETKEGYELNLENHKIIGDDKINIKLIITAKAISKKAKEQIEKAGGKIILK